jgi:hypothetical protein
MLLFVFSFICYHKIRAFIVENFLIWPQISKTKQGTNWLINKYFRTENHMMINTSNCVLMYPIP